MRHFPMPKSLCVTWLRQHRTRTACSTFGRKQGRKSGNGWSWSVTPEVREKAPHTSSACCSGSRGKTSAASKCHHHLVVLSKTWNCSYAPHLTRVEGALKVKGEESPVMTGRWRYPTKSHHGEMGCMAPLQLGRLRRPSTRRVAGSRGHSTRVTGEVSRM